MAQTAVPVQLKHQTTDAFEAYIREAEAKMTPSLEGSEPFLWSDCIPKRAQQVRKGEIVAQLWTGKDLVRVPDGLIHDWVGAAWIPGTTLQKTLSMVQDYDHHKHVYKPDVIDSKLLSHQGNDYKIYLRLLKKKIITVVLDTDHDVHYSALRPHALVLTLLHDQNFRGGKRREAEREGGALPIRVTGSCGVSTPIGDSKSVTAVCTSKLRAISLTRDVPAGLGWIIEPIVRKLPRQSLINTLAATRKALS